MEKFELNKEYSLKLGEAEPINSIYLGIKTYRGHSRKHVFLAYTRAYRSFNMCRFYLGNADKVFFKNGIVEIKNPQMKWINELESKILKPFIEKLSEA